MQKCIECDEYFSGNESHCLDCREKLGLLKKEESNTKINTEQEEKHVDFISDTYLNELKKQTALLKSIKSIAVFLCVLAIISMVIVFFMALYYLS